MKNRPFRLVFAMCSIFVTAQPVMAQDTAAGATVFKQRCSVCHKSEAGAPAGIGPNLAGVAGRAAGSTAFNYSPALKNSHLKWDKATLDRYLSGPSKLVPGTRMSVSVSDPVQRTALIAYLATLKK